MGLTREPLTYRNRLLGVAVLTAAQLLIGVVHVFSGVWLLSAGAQMPVVYGVYTLVFGVLTSLFAYGVWFGKRWGWMGTVGVSLFVIVADGLTLLGLPSIPGIPKLAGVFEILYSVMVLVYLVQDSRQNQVWFNPLGE